MLWRARTAEKALKASKPEDGERLLIEAAKKDPGRFADLYDVHFDRVYAFIARRVRVRDVAQDLTSDVFHKALANLGKYEPRGVPFVAWLMRIASNAIADRWKRAAKESGNPAPEETEAGEVDLETIEHRAKLFQLVRTLPTDQRRVIQMRFAEEKSIREIANALKKTEGAVKQLQFRALQILRERMGGKQMGGKQMGRTI
jgi:RNA polymerase sigma-70 factor (ECF subfamily)